LAERQQRGDPAAIDAAQVDALVVGLPWERLPEMTVITRP
jgi:hypothetical protein